MKLGNIILLAILAVLVYLVYKFYNNKKKIQSILFIGDSNTVAPFSYADQIKNINPNLTVKKIAQNGANTSWMLEQLESELSQNNYDAVSILGGSNDIYGGMDLGTTKSNLNKMYLLAKARGSKVIAITPPNKDYYVNRTEDKQLKLYDLVNWISSNPLTDYFIDFYTLTKGQGFFTAADGYLHPQANAHNILANTLNSQIA